MKLDAIISLSQSMKQVVQTPTRKNKILDPIITSLSKYYLSPECLPPLDNDPDKNGSPSDHMIVYMKPIDSANLEIGRKQKSVTFRPLKESGIRQMGSWIVQHQWDEVLNVTTAHEKAVNLQNILLDKLNLYLPEKSSSFTSDDQPWFTHDLKQLLRSKQREYSKNRKSIKYLKLEKIFQTKCKEAKASYYKNIVSDLKESDPKKWYSKLKRMSNFDQAKSEVPIVDSISSFSDQDQANLIADSFSEISNSYDPVDPDEIFSLPCNNKPMPVFEPHMIYLYLKNIYCEE